MSTRVLIIDDEADVRAYLETLLRENGFETAVASDGDSGFDLAKSFRPEVITLDIIMPRETGVKFYRKLRKDANLKNTPVIILSGVTRYKELFARDHATMPRPFAFVEKPIDNDELVAKVHEAAGVATE
jgi:DNA-binding response OmpR family regulator